MMYTVYVIRSQVSGTLYTGQTSDFPRRFAQHQQGLAHYTRGRGPWEIMLTEEYVTLREAIQRERFLKSGRGREWLKERMKAMNQPADDN
jgi:putative endonuclease